MTSPNGNIFHVTGPLCGEFNGHRWITKANDAELWCFFYQRLNKRLNKQSWGWWSETPSRPLWRHCNVITASGCWTASGIHHYQILSSPLDRRHYRDVIMSAMASQITSITIVYSTVCSCVLAFVRGIHQSPVNSLAQKANNAEHVPILNDVIMTDVQ